MSSTPAEVLTNQQIGSLHKKIVCIQEQLERLPTIEGIRTEIARLAAQNYPALPTNVETRNFASLHDNFASPDFPSSPQDKCKAIALAQQMRGWFETLGYRFEKYKI